MRAGPFVLAVLLAAATAFAVRAEEKPEKPAPLTPEEKKALTDAEKEAKKEHDEAVKKLIEQLKKDLREAKSDNDQAAAVLKLGGDERDPKIVAAVAPFLSAGGPLVRGEAIGVLRVYRKDRAAALALMGALPANKNMEGVLDKLLTAIGQVGHDSALPVLQDHLKDRDSKIAVAAVNGLAEMNSAAAVDLLMTYYARIEKEHKGGGGTNIGGVNESEERYRVVAPALLLAAGKIAGQKLKDYSEADAWWEKTKAVFKPKLEEEAHGCPVHQPKVRKGDRLVPMAPTGGILREFWRNIPGGAVKDLTSHALFAGPPSMKMELKLFEAPSNMGDNYGQRIRGYVYAPADGEYVFSVAADDNAELWISTDDSPDNKTLACKTEGQTGKREFAQQPGQQSKPVSLKAGKPYYIEALHKEGTQGDYCAVAWKVPDAKELEVIPGSRLASFGPAK